MRNNDPSSTSYTGAIDRKTGMISLGNVAAIFPRYESRRWLACAKLVALVREAMEK